MTARFAPLACASADRALDGGLVAGDHDLGAAIVVRRVADLALRRLAGDLERGLVFEAEQGRHRPLPHRNRLLHGVAADAQQPRRIGDREAAGGGERRIFAERMAGDEGGVALQVEAGLGLQHAHGRQADGHEGRLGVRGEGELLGRPLPDEARQLLRQGRVHLVEDGPGLRKGLGQRLAHADGLAALARKDECARHDGGAPP